jgi:hypothetical protein
LSSAGLYWKLGLACAALGSVLTVVGPFAAQRQYASTSVLRFTASGPNELDLGPVFAVEQEVLSRTSLSGIIQRPELNLYRSERERVPLEDVINGMRMRDLKVLVDRRDGRSVVLKISYHYPDRGKAQAVVQNVVDRFANSFVWQAGVNSHMRGATPIRENLEVIEPPTRPVVAADQHRLRTILFGSFLGLLLGVFAAFFVKQPRRAIIVASAWLVGCIAGVACSFLMTPRYISSATMRIVPHDHLSGTAEGRQWLERLTRQVVGQGAVKYHLSSDGTAVELELTNRDPSKAQSDLHRTCTKLVDAGRAEIQGTDRPGSVLHSGIVEFVDNASLPVTPAFPNRMVVGLMLGFGTALAAGWMMFKPRRQLVAA